MRVTSEMMVANTLRRLSTRMASYEQVQSQLATGKRVLKPSDDPGSAARAMSLRASMRSREQEARNAADARSWLDITDSQLQSSVTRLQRARDLTVRGATEGDAGERRALASELRTIIDELAGIANTTHRGRPLFAGTAGGDAVTPTTDPGPPPTTTWAYTGDDGTVERRVGDADVVTVNVTAAQALGFGHPNGDILTALGRIADALEAGDAAAVTAGLADIDRGRTALTDSLAQIGATTGWVDSAQRRSADTIHALRTELSLVEDVDIAEAIMGLQVQEVAYQATLQAAARALPPSLASFLR